MKENSSTFDKIADEFVVFLQVVKSRLSSPEEVIFWFQSMGIEFEGLDDNDLLEAHAAVQNAEQAIGKIDFSQPIEEQWLNFVELGVGIAALVNVIAHLPQNFEQKLVDANIGYSLELAANDILLSYIEYRAPLVFALFQFFGVVEVSRQSVPGRNLIYTRKTLHADKLPKLFSDPEQLIKDKYCDDGEFNYTHFSEQLVSVLHILGIPARWEATPSIELDDNAQLVVPPESNSVFISLYQSLSTLSLSGIEEVIGLDIDDSSEIDNSLETEVFSEILLVLAPLIESSTTETSTAEPSIKGIALMPQLSVDAGISIPIAEQLTLDIEGGIDGGPIIAVSAEGAELLGSVQEINGALGLTLGNQAENYLLGTRNESYIRYGSFSTRLGLRSDFSETEVLVTLALKDLEIHLDIGSADSFLKSIIGDATLDAALSATLQWSSLNGVSFDGGAGLALRVPLDLDLRILRIDAIGLELDLVEDLSLNVSADLSSQLGPFAASVEAIGFSSKLKLANHLPDSKLSLDFLPPKGAGFVLDSGIATGGGFLTFDTKNERYAGIMALKLGEVSVTAIGLITTKLPNGNSTFSMLVSIGVIFDPPIQLSMGFTLSGVGGLIGVNRSMKVDVLREGILSGTLDSILFPEPSWLLANANRVISDLRRVFPPTQEHFVIGPMIAIGYGSPNFVVGELGIFAEFSLDEFKGILLLGQVKMSLPKPDKEIVAVNINVVGSIDLRKKELAFKASISASSMMVFSFEGDCAFFLRWGPNSELALAIGGFHPRFQPPAPPTIFANLRRLALTVNYGPFVRLGCRGYLAVTPNSLQFGGRISVLIGVRDPDVGISGFLSFDSLILFSPFSFAVDLNGGMQIKIFSQTIASVRVALHLSGPAPWHVRGSLTIGFLFFEIGVGFSFRFGRKVRVPIAAVDPWPILFDALSENASWQARLAPYLRRHEKLASREANQSGDEQTIVVHPAGYLAVQQNSLPFGLRLNKLGNAPIEQFNEFKIRAFKVGDEILSHKDLSEQFSRGQYQRLNNKDKLSTPSFEKFVAGAEASRSNKIEVSQDIETVDSEFETIFLTISEPVDKEKTIFSKHKSSSASHVNGNDVVISPSPRSATWASSKARRGEPLISYASSEVKYVLVDRATLQPVKSAWIMDSNLWGTNFTHASTALDDYVTVYPTEGEFLALAAYEMDTVGLHTDGESDN